MRTSVGQPVRLGDYRVPDYFIDHVELDVSLDIHATRVVSTLSMRPNPAGREGAALSLDGDELLFISARLDGEPLGAADFEASPSEFRASAAAKARVQAHDRDPTRSGGQHQAHGPLSLGLGLLHAMRGGGISPHHLFSRSAGRALDLSRAARGGPGRGAGAARQRQSRNRGRSGDRPAATSPSGAIRTRSRATCSRWSRAIWARSRIPSSPPRARTSRSRSMSSTAAKSARATRWTRSSGRWPGTSGPTGANTISTCSTSSPSPTSIWARWRTRASTSSTTNTCSRRPRRRPTTITPASRASSRTNIFTTGPAIASPAATGSSSASRRG